MNSGSRSCSQYTSEQASCQGERSFDTDFIVKRFYHRFKAEHSTFQACIQGISPEAERAAYASLMLNRLMFLYFLQKKGFLAGDIDYLANHLRMMHERKGQEDACHSFYRHFLLPLFHERLGIRPDSDMFDRDALLGKIPSLNCSLFRVHLLELDHPDIQIPDTAFARLFAFFDAYQWRLDERPPDADNEITPAILGCIFEQYINQKQMGAYYTKEDISEYIAKNTIIPFLFTATQQRCPTPFEPNGPIWRLLREKPDRYIYEAVRCEHFLPTEREYTARHQRYAEIKARLVAGEVTCINDFITNNLDIRRFAQDVIEHCEEPGIVQAFHECIEQMTILDPTCGSGAFLFAALNILEPLYEACLDRDMPQRNRRYFILKSIILNNLYGVDIMEEAIEICKLRLLLTLVAQIERIEDIEPFPDIDGNIRAGNALIGFANYDGLSKADLIDLNDAAAFEQWRMSHRPFHWVIEFDKIMQRGGFDVIIGNPPYAEYRSVKGQYMLPPGAYETESCGNLYAFCMERCAALSNAASTFGLIVPLSLVCTDRMAAVRRILYTAYSHLWCSNYDTIPGTLFAGIVQRHTIVLATKFADKHTARLHTTKNQQWYASERAFLFEGVSYMPLCTQSANDPVPKLGTQIALNILRKIQAQQCAITSYTQPHSNNTLLYKRRWSYFLLFADTIAAIVLPDGSTRQQQDVKTLALQADLDSYIFVAALNSRLFYFHYSVFSDLRHVNRADFERFSFDYRKLSEDTANRLSRLGKRLMQSYTDNLQWRMCNYVGSIGECRVPFYRQGMSKPIIDEIDGVLAEHYGFTDEELDFILNYEVKYRMGK